MAANSAATGSDAGAVAGRAGGAVPAVGMSAAGSAGVAGSGFAVSLVTGAGRGFATVAGVGLWLVCGAGGTVRVAKVCIGIWAARLPKFKDKPCSSARCNSNTARLSISQAFSGVLGCAMSTRIRSAVTALWDFL